MAMQRYGLRITKSAAQDIVNKIQHGKARFIEKQSNRVSVWEVSDDDGNPMRIVYDKLRHTIVTFLPGFILEPAVGHDAG